jgi:hypothetical protein
VGAKTPYDYRGVSIFVREVKGWIGSKIVCIQINTRSSQWYSDSFVLQEEERIVAQLRTGGIRNTACERGFAAGQVKEAHLQEVAPILPTAPAPLAIGDEQAGTILRHGQAARVAPRSTRAQNLLKGWGS